MARFRVPFNARLYDIKEAFVRGEKGPLVAYLRSGIIDADVQMWLADTIDPAIAGGHKLAIKGPPHRPAGGKAWDNAVAIGEAMHALMNDPADQRSERDKVKEAAVTFGCSDSKIRKDYRDWKKARQL